MTRNPTPSFSLKGFHEWPTWALLAGVYGGWWLCLSVYHSIGALPAGALLVLIGTLHTSVQHELLHGHPTRWAWLNSLLAYPPLVLLFPYPIYRDSHIQHHNNSDLTLPGIDPESYYVSRRRWENSCKLFRAYCIFRMTLFGRLLTGPLHSIIELARQAFADFQGCSTKNMLIWIAHICLVSAILGLIHTHFEIPIWHYLVIAYFANALAMLRSFYEHRAVKNIEHRTAVVEGCRFFCLLFLNNNYHFLHHEYPKTPWYQLPALYRLKKGDALLRNGNFLVNGYQTWLLKHLFVPVDSPAHPFNDD